MNRSANVHSIESIRDFRAALVSFCEDARDALVVIELEAQRGVHWVQDEQPQYWQHQVRKRGDAVLNAKSELDRARAMPVPGGHPTCREEKMAVERAKQRVAAAEEKVQTTRKWGHTVEHEVAEYQGRANQLMALLDGKMPQAIAFLDRALNQLEAYLALELANESSSSGHSSATVRPVPAKPIPDPAAAAQQTKVNSDETRSDESDTGAPQKRDSQPSVSP